jgi:predicted permease
VRSATDAPAAQRTLRSLVVAQLALAFLLVVASGLLVRTLFELSKVDPGFDPDRVLILNLGGDNRFNASSEDERMRRAAALRDLHARIQALPGVEGAAFSWLGLFGGSDLWMRYKLDARDGERRTARVDYVSPEYFDVLGMRVLRGRTFRDDDRPGGRRPAVINESMARQRFDGDAIGREFRLDTPADTGVPFAVIGVVADSKYNDVRETIAEPMAWLPLADVGGVAMRSITVRAAPGAMAGVTDGVRRVLASVNPDLLIRRSAALSDLIVDTRRRERLLFGLSVGLGAVALLLAALGMYGMLSQTLARRRREMGVRLALGAPPAALRRMILTSAARLVLVALALAVPLAIAAGGALRSFLFGVQPTDIATLVSSALFVAVLALAAAYLPARRAAGVDPLEIIRGE